MAAVVNATPGAAVGSALGNATPRLVQPWYSIVCVDAMQTCSDPRECECAVKTLWLLSYSDDAVIQQQTQLVVRATQRPSAGIQLLIRACLHHQLHQQQRPPGPCVQPHKQQQQPCGVQQWQHALHACDSTGTQPVPGGESRRARRRAKQNRSGCKVGTCSGLFE